MSKQMYAKANDRKKADDVAQQNHEKHLLLLSLTAEIMKAAISASGLVAVTAYRKREDGLASFAKDVYAALDDAHNSNEAK